MFQQFAGFVKGQRIVTGHDVEVGTNVMKHSLSRAIVLKRTDAFEAIKFFEDCGKTFSLWKKIKAIVQLYQPGGHRVDAMVLFVARKTYRTQEI